MLSGFATEAAAMEYENLLQSCFENQQVPRRSSHRSIHEIEHLPYGALRPTLLAESAQTTRY
jgi:hypothetical protein